jgi:hypothetical protein
MIAVFAKIRLFAISLRSAYGITKHYSVCRFLNVALSFEDSSAINFQNAFGINLVSQACASK